MFVYFYYFMLPFTLSASVLGCYFLMDPVNAKQMVGRWSWNASKTYIICKDWGTKISSYLEVSDADDDGYDSSSEHSHLLTIKEENQIVMYDPITRHSYIGDVPENEADSNELTSAIRPSIIFIKTKLNNIDYYKRTLYPSKTDSCYLTFMEKPFIQIEYIIGEEVSDIHTFLTGFYVNGNKILDKEFLQWYLYYYYNKILKDGYTLRVFDKDVNMFIIKDNQYIQLNNNTYVMGNE